MIVKLFLLLSAAIALTIASPLNKEGRQVAPNYRLSEDIKPSSYAIEITPHFDNDTVSVLSISISII